MSEICGDLIWKVRHQLQGRIDEASMSLKPPPRRALAAPLQKARCA